MQQHLNQGQGHSKGAPGRRRPIRNTGHSSSHKSYASENDMPSDVGVVNGAPFTPQNSASNSPAPASLTAQPKSKPRTGAKSRPKNVTISPGPIKFGRTTPPHTAPHASAPKSSTAAVFAGATFHASPNPSSLPMPSFLAKAMGSPSPALKDAGCTAQEPSPPPTDSEAPTSQHRATVSDVARNESPLDFFFRAQREEQERDRRASAAKTAATAPGSLSPSRTYPFRSSIAFSGEAAMYDIGPASCGRQSRGIPPNELDGAPGRPMGPAFSTPYQDRIRAARSSERDVVTRSSEKNSVDRGKFLLSYIRAPAFSTGVRTSAVPGQGIPSSGLLNSGPQDATITTTTTSVTTTTKTTNIAVAAATGVDGRSADVLRMEDSLRRMLKLDPTLSNSS